MWIKAETEDQARDRYEHWHRIGGVVVDVINLLESVARVHPAATNYDAKQLRAINRLAPLVASHALRPILAELNEEAENWFLQQGGFEVRRQIQDLRKRGISISDIEDITRQTSDYIQRVGEK